MRILAFDTSTRFLSVACLEGDAVKASFHEDVGIKHNEMLVSVIDDLLKSSGWGIKDIELVCVGTGPGSFTGLRIGVVTAKGFAAVTGCNVIGVPSMDAMIMNFDPGEKFAAPFLDARKGKVYTSVYDLSSAGPHRITDYLLVTVDDLLEGMDKDVTFFGDAVPLYSDKLDACPKASCKDNIDWFPRAADIGIIGGKRAKSSSMAPEDLEPLYLHARECNITEKKV